MNCLFNHTCKWAKHGARTQKKSEKNELGRVEPETIHPPSIHPAWPQPIPVSAEGGRLISMPGMGLSEGILSTFGARDSHAGGPPVPSRQCPSPPKNSRSLANIAVICWIHYSPYESFGYQTVGWPSQLWWKLLKLLNVSLVRKQRYKGLLDLPPWAAVIPAARLISYFLLLLVAEIHQKEPAELGKRQQLEDLLMKPRSQPCFKISENW